MVNPGSSFEQLSSTRAPNAGYQVSKSSAFWFTIYGHGGHLGHVTRTVWTNFYSPVPRRFHMKFGFNRSSGFRREDVWKCWHIYNTQTHIQTTEAYQFYKLTNEPKGSGELIKWANIALTQQNRYVSYLLLQKCVSLVWFLDAPVGNLSGLEVAMPRCRQVQCFKRN